MGLHNVRLVEQGQNRGCQKQHGPVSAGPSFPLKGGRSHVLDNMRFNLAIHLPLRWIAALLYLMR